MIRIYLISVCLLPYLISPSKFKIFVDEPLKPLNFPTTKLPEGTMTLPILPQIQALKSELAKFLWENPTEDIKAWRITKKHTFSPDSNYIIVGYSFPDNSYLSTNSNAYAFTWKKKKYSDLTKFEKQLADYYYVNKNTDIAFLYPYKKYDQDPWTIKVGNQYHSAVWVQTKLKERRDDDKEFFLHVEENELKAKIDALINYKNEIIAKRINGVITFCPDSQQIPKVNVSNKK